MENTDPSVKKEKPEEEFEISFLGFRFKCSNPGTNAIIMLILLLIFFVVLAVLLPAPLLRSG